MREAFPVICDSSKPALDLIAAVRITTHQLAKFEYNLILASKIKNPLARVYFPLALILPPMIPSSFLIWRVKIFKYSPAWRVPGKKLIHTPRY
jgi:hypothetical protein